MTKLSVLKKHWWTPFLTTALIGSFLFFLLPSFTLIALNSRSSMLGLIALGCIGLPWVIARLHQISPVPPASGFYLVMMTGWILQPSSFDGNYKLALATYLTPWIISALAANAAISSFLLRKRLSA